MRQRVFLAVCMIAVLLLSLCQSQSSVAKKKAASRLKGGLDMDISKMEADREDGMISRHYLVERGKTYNLWEFLNTGGGGFAKEELRVKMKKKPWQNVTLSGAGLKIKKQTFKVNKAGRFNLKVETEKKTYLFPLYAVNKKYVVNKDEILRVWITIHTINFDFFTAAIDEPEVIQQIAEKINRADYTFDLKRSLQNRPGNTGYIIEFQWKDGRVSEMKTLNYGGFNVSTGWGNRASWSSGSQSARDFVDYIAQIFNTYAPGHEDEPGYQRRMF